MPRNLMINWFIIQSYTYAFILLLAITSCKEQAKANAIQNSALKSSTKQIDSNMPAEASKNQNFTSIYKSAPEGEAISQVVRKIVQDREGNVWIGGQSGLFKYNGTQLHHFDEIGNPFGQKVTIKDMAEDSNGTLWLAHTGGVSSYNGEKVANYSTKDGLLHNDVWSMLVDQQNVVWIGGLQGVNYFDGTSFHTFPIPEGKIDSTRGVSSTKMVHCIMEDRKGNIWFGTNGGAYRYDGKTLINFSEKGGLSSNFVNDILEDSKGNIWFATTHGGLCMYNGKVFTNLTKEHSLEGKELWEIYEDTSQHLWISGKHMGIYRYNGTTFDHYNEKDGLDDPGIMDIFEDKEGRMWFGGVYGLYRFNGTSFVYITKNGPWKP